MTESHQTSGVGPDCLFDAYNPGLRIDHWSILSPFNVVMKGQGDAATLHFLSMTDVMLLVGDPAVVPINTLVLLQDTSDRWMQY